MELRGLNGLSLPLTFEAHGVDAFAAGLLCYDEWEDIPAVYDNDGNMTAPDMLAGNRYGMRYEEALALEAAYMRREIARLKPSS